MHDRIFHAHATRKIASFALLAVMCCVAPVASATKFTTFLQYESPTDAQLRSDGYPGRTRIANHRQEPVCLYFRYKNEQGEVVRLSKVGVRIPAQRSDLSVTGPGDNARSLEMTVERAGQACGSYGESDGRAVTVVRAGEIKSGNHRGVPFEADARAWNANSRDVTITVR